MADNTFARIGGAFYRNTPTGYIVVSDAATQSALRSGQQSFQDVDPFANGGVKFATPNSSPETKVIPINTPGGIQNPLLGGGTPAAPPMTSTPMASTPAPFNPQTPSAPAAPSGPNPIDSFNLLLTDSLKQAQGMNTVDLLKRKRDLERAMLEKGALTPEMVGTMSPQQQEAFRQGKVETLSPLFDENAYSLAKANAAIQNFEKVYIEAQKFGSDFAEKMVAPDNVIQSYARANEANPDSMATILSGANNKTKQAVIAALDYTKLSQNKPKTTSIQNIGGKMVLLDTQTGEVVKELGAAPQNQMTDNERALFNVFNSNQIVKDYNNIVSQKLAFDNVVKNGVGGPADLAMVYMFMKGLDPTSVVRETEYATAAASGNIFLGAYAKFNGYFKESGGFLPPNVRTEFQNIVNQRLAAQQQQYDNWKNQIRSMAERQGMNPDNVVIDFAGALQGAEGETKTLNGVQYKKVNGGWQKVSDAGGSASGSTATNRPQRNNNPLNIKASSTTLAYPGVVGTDPSPATDGGQFLKFSSASDGFNAAKTLLKSGVYSGMSVDSAMRKWSGGGYGGEVAPSIASKPISSLTPAELDQLIQAMAQREGYYA